MDFHANNWTFSHEIQHSQRAYHYVTLPKEVNDQTQHVHALNKLNNNRVNVK